MSVLQRAGDFIRALYVYDGKNFRTDAISQLHYRVFKFLVGKGNVGKEEAFRVFNMGVGMVWFVPSGEASKAVDLINSCGYESRVIGEVVSGSGKVHVN